MYVSHIDLQNWKNFQAAGADLPPRAFLIGPNASGKSNFLDVFRFLRDLAGVGLQRAVETRGGVSAIRCLSARASSSIGIAVTVAKDDAAPLWKYEVEFNQDAARRVLLRVERVTDLRTGDLVVDRPEDPDRDDPLRLTQTALEQIVANREFRDVADFFGAISYQHVVPQLVRDPRGFSPSPVHNDPFGRDLLRRIHATNPQSRDARLRRISYVLEQAVPNLKKLEISMDQEGTPHLIGRYQHWRPHDARQNESQFSDGTLRLFGLMWAMLEGTGPLLLEEPELSLHPEVVRYIPQMLTRLQEAIRKMKRRGEHESRQIIVSTHSEEMLRDTGIGAAEVLRICPTPEGSQILAATEDDSRLMETGLSAADVILPKTRPHGGQLMLEFK